MRSDSNAAEIAKELRKAGATVCYLDPQGMRWMKGCPDFLVGFRGVTMLIEVKKGKGKLNDNQIEWRAKWNGAVPVEVWSVDDALRAIGVLP